MYQSKIKGFFFSSIFWSQAHREHHHHHVPQLRGNFYCISNRPYLTNGIKMDIISEALLKVRQKQQTYRYRNIYLVCLDLYIFWRKIEKDKHIPKAQWMGK